MGTKRKMKDKTEAQAALAAFDKKHEGKPLDDAQKKARAALKKVVDSEKFRTLANVRISKALNGIEGLAKLARLPHTKEQVDTLKGEFQTALQACFAHFDTKAEKNGVKTVRQVL